MTRLPALQPPAAKRRPRRPPPTPVDQMTVEEMRALISGRRAADRARGTAYREKQGERGFGRFSAYVPYELMDDVGVLVAEFLSARPSPGIAAQLPPEGAGAASPSFQRQPVPELEGAVAVLVKTLQRARQGDASGAPKKSAAKSAGRPGAAVAGIGEPPPAKLPAVAETEEREVAPPAPLRWRAEFEGDPGQQVRSALKRAGARFDEATEAWHGVAVGGGAPDGVPELVAKAGGNFMFGEGVA